MEKVIRRNDKIRTGIEGYEIAAVDLFNKLGQAMDEADGKRSRAQVIADGGIISAAAVAAVIEVLKRLEEIVKEKE